MKLVLHIQGPKSKKVIEVNKSSHFTVGRKNCDLIIEDGFCSSQHALLFEGHDGELHLRDLGSRNGTYCEKEKIEEVILQPESQFRIGGTTVRIIIFEPANPKPSNENNTEKTNKNSTPLNPDVLMGWPNVMRATDKERLKELVDYIDENGRKNSVRLADILAARKKAG